MTEREQRQLLRNVKGLYNYQVRGPMILFFVALILCAWIVLSFLLVGAVGWLARASPFFLL
jgi:hypothetical protein